MRIVEMNEQHVAAIAEMEMLCFPVPWSENSVRNELFNPLSYWLVALDEDRLVGYVGSQSAAGESDIMNLAVHPDYRNRGIAMLLIERLQKELLKRENSALLLEVRKSNQPAIGLYEKMGFQQVGIRPNYYFSPREDALIMRKELMET